MIRVATDRDSLEYLAASVETLHLGLQGLMELLAGAPPERTVGAAHLRTLLAPLADEASQCEPLTRMLLAAA